MKILNHKNSVLDLPLHNGQNLTVKPEELSQSFVPDKVLIETLVTSFPKKDIELVIEGDIELEVVNSVPGASEFIKKSEEVEVDEVIETELSKEIIEEPVTFEDDSSEGGLSSDEKVQLLKLVQEKGTELTSKDLESILKELEWDVEVWYPVSVEFLNSNGINIKS